MGTTTTKPTIRWEPLFNDTQLPSKATPGSAGMDLYAHLNRGVVQCKLREGSEPTFCEVRHFSDGGEQLVPHIILRPGDKAIVPLGFKAALPEGHVALICPRSGNSFSRGLDIPNAPGVIDEDYRGEWGVILKNASSHVEVIRHGDRIAQMLILAVARVDEEIADSLDNTVRGEGGFGSTDTSTDVSTQGEA